MSWLVMSLRRSELTRSINQHTYEKLLLNREKTKLSSFVTALGDGMITPSEIGNLGCELFGDALDFMATSNFAAAQVANLQTAEYAKEYDSLTQQQYYNNPSITAQARLYYKDGVLDTEKMYSEFYKEALKEFVQQYIMPIIKEKEDEIDNKANDLQTLVELEQAELQELKQAISSDIQNSSIKLS